MNINRWCLVILFSSLFSDGNFAEEKGPNLEIEEVLLAASFLDGGSFSLSAITTTKKLIYIHASPDEQNGRGIAYVENINLIHDKELAAELLLSFVAWKNRQFADTPLESWILSKKPIPESIKKALLIQGFIEEICAMVKIPSWGKSQVVRSVVCKEGKEYVR